MMKRCVNCGKIMREDAKFCPNCGHSELIQYNPDETVSLSGMKEEKKTGNTQDSQEPRTEYRKSVDYNYGSNADFEDHEKASGNADTQKEDRQDTSRKKWGIRIAAAVAGCLAGAGLAWTIFWPHDSVADEPASSNYVAEQEDDTVDESTVESSVTEDQPTETESLTTDEEIMNDADEDAADAPLTVIEVEIPEDGVEVTDENRNEVALSRLMSVDSDEFQYLELNAFSTDWWSNGVRWIAELPDDDIRMYCYYDDEVWYSGVAFDIKGEICYFDWCYAGVNFWSASMYWNEKDQQLQVICDPSHGTGFYAQDLYVVQKNHSGEWVSYHYGYDDYSKALEERIQLVFDDQKEVVTIIDKKTGVELASQIDTLDVFSWTDVDEIMCGCISRFEFGETIVYASESISEYGGIGLYYPDDIPRLEFELILNQDENGDISFELGAVEAVYGTVGE